MLLMPRPSVQPARAFTLLELVVVMVILGILIAMAVPRMGSNENRRVELAIEQTADLLLMYAQREMGSRTPIGIEYDPNEGAFRVLRLENAAVDSENVHAEWFEDPNVKPVFLPTDLFDPNRVEVRADGEPIDTSLWPLTHDIGQDRPEIEVVLPAPQATVTLVLPTYAIAPYRLGEHWAATVREPIDLDAEGRDREEW